MAFFYLGEHLAFMQGNICLQPSSQWELFPFTENCVLVWQSAGVTSSEITATAAFTALSETFFVQFWPLTRCKSHFSSLKWISW